MSKQLDEQDINIAKNCFENPNENINSLCTLLTALIMLDPNKQEKDLINYLHTLDLNPVLKNLLNKTFSHPLKKSLEKIIHHHHLSDIEMLAHLKHLTTHTHHDPINAIFLEGLRLKEESSSENTTALNYFYHQSNHIHCKCKLLLEFANPYDGFTRFYPIQFFSSLILASMGISCVFHGVYESGPKFGLTMEKLLLKANIKPSPDLKNSKTQLENPDISWSYISQQHFCPDLYQLQTLRKHIVKRPFLATIEKFLMPIYADKMITLTGFTHPAYRTKSIHLLTKRPIPSDFILIRGQEGSSQAPIDRKAPCITAFKQKIHEKFTSPENFNIPTSERCKEESLDEDFLLEQGLNVLQNKKSPLTNSILYQCQLILDNIAHNDLKHILPLQEVLKTKKAFKLFTHLQNQTH